MDGGFGEFTLKSARRYGKYLKLYFVAKCTFIIAVLNQSGPILHQCWGNRYLCGGGGGGGAPKGKGLGEQNFE